MPPNYSLTMILCSSPREERAEILAREVNKNIREIVSDGNFTAQIIGPFEAPIKKLRNRFRWQMLLKADNIRPLLNLLNHVFENKPSTKRDELIQIDVDPYNLM